MPQRGGNKVIHTTSQSDPTQKLEKDLSSNRPLPTTAPWLTLL